MMALTSSADRGELDRLALVAHELFAPLSALVASAELLAEDLEMLAPPVIREMINTMLRQALVVQNIAENVLCVNAMDQVRFSIHPHLLDLADIVEEAQTLLAHLLERREQHLEVRVRRAKSIPAVCADRLRILQVVMNLVLNASKFSGPGTILVSLSHKNGSQRLTVGDRGLGIPKEERELVLERFYRGSSPDIPRSEGAGLGLFVARRIVEAHGGRIRVEGRQGSGTNCWFELPTEARSLSSQEVA